MTETEATVKYILENSRDLFPQLRQKLTSKRVILVPLAQKMGGKTFYVQFFLEALGKDFFSTIVAGDLVRNIKKSIEQNDIKAINKVKSLFPNETNVIDTIAQSSSSNLVPDHIIISLIEDSIRQSLLSKSVILDGIPRSLEQVSYLNKLKNELGAKLLFIYFKTDYEILDVRADSRRICPNCHLDKNLLSSPTSEIIFENNSFVMICDKCRTKMINKQGDEKKEDIFKARQQYEAIIFGIKDQFGPDLEVLETSVPVSDYHGPLKEINKQYSFSINKNKVVSDVTPQVINTKEGPKYSLSAEYNSIQIARFLLEKL